MKTQKPEEKTEQADEAAVVTDSPERIKTAFFITPLGGDNSEIRRATDGLIDAVIEPALKQYNIDLVPPHKIKNPGNITRQIVRHILESDLVIANLTGLNANVMYELAIRHAKRRPVIVIAEKGTILPFDIAAERTIFYTNDMGGVVELKARLDETIPVALIDENPENPVYSGLEASIIQEQLKQEKDSVQSYLVEKIDQLTDSVSAIRNNYLSSQSVLNKSSNDMPWKYSLTFQHPMSYNIYHNIKDAILSLVPDANDIYADVADVILKSVHFSVNREINTSEVLRQLSKIGLSPRNLNGSR